MKVVSGVLLALFLVLLIGYAAWPTLLNVMLPADSRPAEIVFAVESVTDEGFEQIAADLRRGYSERFDHLDRFRKAGIRSYEGPKTCLRCHESIQIEDALSGEVKTVDLMENLTTSAHYRFFSNKHPNVYGFNGELADDFPMGKIDRPCPKPGSFSFTAWAETVELKDGRVLSEGCGQCHIGGQYQAPLGEILPGYRTTQNEKNAVDCLICHAVAYDMNKKQAITDDNGRTRWGQDRSMVAALSTVTPTAQTCLRCHQHNFGGDIYVDELDNRFMESQWNLGESRPRVAHPGSKRGTPYSPSWDVHAVRNIACIDCHETEGHFIAAGLHTTTLMANDLPTVDVSCEQCHSAEPHEASELAPFYNTHTDRVACVTCHIPTLQEDNVTRRDFSEVEFEEKPGIFIYSDVEKEADGRRGIMYRWWNGDATFLGNPIGDNPNGAGLYSFYRPKRVWPEFKDFDYSAWYERVMRPIANRKTSKLYAMKRFNGKQHIDLANMTPFGGMYVPYNLPDYYVNGNPDQAASKEMEKSMMGMMYGLMFKVYLLDKFMTFMDADGWDTSSYEDVKNLKNVEARWLPMDASLETSHAIRRNGALTCNDCHSPNGVLDWRELGYTQEEIETYQENPLE
jgi:hypothetical protein